LIDLIHQVGKSREIAQMGILFLDITAEILNRIELWRVGGQLIDRQSFLTAGKKFKHGLTGMIPGAILNEDDRLLGLDQHLGQEGLITFSVELAGVGLVEQSPGAEVNQAKDFVTFA
jgi:hypothetical protein